MSFTSLKMKIFLSDLAAARIDSTLIFVLAFNNFGLYFVFAQKFIDVCFRWWNAKMGLSLG